MYGVTRMKSHTGKIYDPVFLFMLIAVILAIGSSFALRSVVSGMGPASAQAADSPIEDSAAPGTSLQITSIPGPPSHTPATAPAKSAPQK